MGEWYVMPFNVCIIFIFSDILYKKNGCRLVLDKIFMYIHTKQKNYVSNEVYV